MKTKLSRISFFFYLCLLPFTAYAGPETVPVVSPTPAPIVNPFKSSELDINLFGVGSWTHSPYKTDQYIGVDHAFGGALAVKYFSPLNLGGVQFGAGLDTAILDSKYTLNTSGRRAIGSSLGQIIARYPIGSFAPYVSLGAGASYGGGTANQIHIETPVKKALLLNDTKFLWSPAAGIEYRMSQNISLLVEGDWNDLGPKKNFMSIRTGIGYAF